MKSLCLVVALTGVAAAQPAEPTQPTPQPPTGQPAPPVPQPPGTPPVPPVPTYPTQPTWAPGTPYPGQPGMPAQPGQPAMPDPNTMQPAPPAPNPEDAKKEKKGDFNAGGQARFPSGPDEMGKYATWNWVAVDVKGQYNLLDAIKVYATIPVAIIKPDVYHRNDDDTKGLEPKMFGGFKATLEARIPKIGPWAKTESAKKTDIALILSGGYMHEGAMKLSEKDFPLFVGDYVPVLDAGLNMKINLGGVIDFGLAPKYFYSAGGVVSDGGGGIQVPMALIIDAGIIKLSAELGVYTGEDFGLRAKNGGRLQAGGSLDIKISKILIHGGLGAASLITGEDSAYPSIRDSFYIDLNAKYVK